MPGISIQTTDSIKTYRSLRYLILILFFLAVGIGTIGYFYYDYQKKALKRERHDDLAAIATLKVNEISQWRKERFYDSLVFMNNPFIVGNINRWLKGHADPQLKKDIIDWMESMSESYDYENILLLDEKASLRLSLPHGNGEVGDYAKRLAEEAMRTKKVLLSDLYFAKDGKEIQIDMFCPLVIRGKDERHSVGVILSRIDPDKFLYRLIQSWPIPSRTAESLIVRREGDEVVYLNELRHRKNTALALRLPISDKSLPAARAALGEEGVFEGRDYRGVEVLAAVRKIPDSPWLLLAKVDTEEVYAPIRSLFWVATTLVCGLVALAAAGAGLIWRSQSAQFYRRQYETELQRLAERGKAEERQAQLIRELASGNKELNDFASIVSHDLKAPLRAIGSLAQWLVSDYADKFDDSGREQMDLLIGRVKRLDNLIDSILAYSKAGRVNEERTEVDVRSLVTDVIDMLSPPASIRITIEGELPTIVCQRTRLEQVFQNLLHNAIKFMDKPEGEIRIGCVPEDGHWKFSVADNGPGIEERYYEKIFQVFQTLRPRDRAEDSGIGLALVKKIIEMYGGRVWIESEVGKGSTFFFTIRKDLSDALSS